MDLDIIVKCRMSGDYSLGTSAETSRCTGLQKGWRIYRSLPSISVPSCWHKPGVCCQSRQLSSTQLRHSWLYVVKRQRHCADR